MLLLSFNFATQWRCVLRWPQMWILLRPTWADQITEIKSRIFFFNLERLHHCSTDSDKAADKEASPLLSEEVLFFLFAVRNIMSPNRQIRHYLLSSPKQQTQLTVTQLWFIYSGGKKVKRIYLYIICMTFGMFLVTHTFLDCKENEAKWDICLRKMLLWQLTLRNNI